MNYISPDFLVRSRTAFSANRPPTLAELRSRIEADSSLSATQRRDLLYALNRLPIWFGRPLAATPATPTALRELFADTSAAKFDRSDKTLANVRSLVGQVVTRYGPPRTAFTCKISLTPAWRALLDRIAMPHYRHALGRLAAYGSAMEIAPEAVDGTTLLGLHEALVAEEMVKNPRIILKNTISGWNRCRRSVAGWPDVVVGSPFKKSPVTFPLAAFPVSFQEDVKLWVNKVTEEASLDDDAPDQALAATTIELRRFQIREFASALVHTGELRVEDLTSLSVIFAPTRFKAAVRWFLQRPHSKESWRLHLLVKALSRIAKHHCKLEENIITELASIAKKLRPRGPRQMATRNRERLRQFDDSRNVGKLLRFPQDQVARARKEMNPLRAAKRVARALTVTLMIYGGLRQATLRQLAVTGDFSWTRPNFEGVCHLHVPARKVKNKRVVERELPAEAAELLRLYLTEYRTRLPGADGAYLFPGVTGGIRARSQFGEGLSRAFRKDTGLELNPHLIRHAVAKIAVERDPGAYLAVSLVLGHSSLSTTLSHYLGTETKAATRHIDRLLTEAKAEPRGKPGRRWKPRTDNKPNHEPKKKED